MKRRSCCAGVPLGLRELDFQMSAVLYGQGIVISKRFKNSIRDYFIITYGAESLHASALRLSRSICLRLNPASRPRLQGCVPAARYDFTGFGLSPNCLTSAELAHPLFLLYIKASALYTGRCFFNYSQNLPDTLLGFKRKKA